MTEGAERLSDLFDATAGEIELRTKSTPPPQKTSPQKEKRKQTMLLLDKHEARAERPSQASR